MDLHDKPSGDHEDEVNIETPKFHDEVVDYVPDTEEERKLVRKIDLFLLPAIWGMYLLSYMVRTMLVVPSPFQAADKRRDCTLVIGVLTLKS